MITDLETQIWKQAYEAGRNRMRVEKIADEMAVRYADAALDSYIWGQAYSALLKVAKSGASDDEMCAHYADVVLTAHKADAARRVSERRANRT